MNHAMLIDAVIRRSAHLVADLAMLSTAPASLQHATDLFFVTLVDRLRSTHGRSQQVVADLFGMPIRTFQYQLHSRTENASLRGSTVWAAIFDFVRRRDQVSRAEIERRYDEPAELIGAALADMVRARLLFCAGRGPTAIYMANPRLSFDEQTTPEVDARLVWVVACSHPDATEAELAAAMGVERSHVQRGRLRAALETLRVEGRLTVDDSRDVQRYRCVDFVLEGALPGAAAAALFDHFSVVVDALCEKLAHRRGDGRDVDDPLARIPATGATYRFDLRPGRAETVEVEGLIEALRARCTALRGALDGDGPATQRLAVYFGHMLEAGPPFVVQPSE